MSVFEYLKEELNESIHDKYLFKSVFMAGGPRSGKSLIASLMFKGQPVNFVNSDIPFEIILRRENLPFDINPNNKEIYAKQQDIRNKAKGLVNTQMGHWINGMLPLIVDGTGRIYNKIEEQRNRIDTIGYDTSMVFVNTSLEVALDRNNKRERKVSIDIVKEAWHNVQANIGKFQNLFGVNNFYIIDNSHSLNDEEITKLELKMVRTSMKILQTPLKNPTGIKILKLLDKTGKSYLNDIPEILDRK